MSLGFCGLLKRGLIFHSTFTHAWFPFPYVYARPNDDLPIVDVSIFNLGGIKPL